MFRMILLLSLLIASDSFAQEDDSYYFGIEYLVSSGDSLKSAGATSGCYRPVGKACRWVYYRAGHEHGVYGEGLYRETDSLYFEMSHSLILTIDKGQLRLRGKIYALNLSSDGTIESGKRTIVNETVSIGKPILIPVGVIDSAEKISLRVTIIHEKPEEIPLMPDSPIRLITTFLDGGKKWSSTMHAFARLETLTTVKTGFGTRLVAGKRDQIKYEVRISLPGIPERIENVYDGLLQFERLYFIDTGFVAGSEFQSDITMTTKYRKSVRLVPGEMFMLVIPPDSPMVRNFGIEDTLVIVPK